MLKEILKLLQKRESLSLQNSRKAFQEILSGAPECQIAAFLALLSAKGETGEEIAGMAEVMREGMVAVLPNSPCLDIVGTGGDGADTVNLSTGSALLAAVCGARVAKHGNRSVSSLCGSADVVKALGLPLHREPDTIVQELECSRFAFLYAPYFHPLMAGLSDIRRNLGIRTALNLAGPLLNPARAPFMVVGVYAPHFVKQLAEALSLLGVQRAFVFHGSGTDEISALGSAVGFLLEGGDIREFTVDPRDYGIAACELFELQGGDAELNASILMDAFSGKQGPVFDSLALGAAVGLYVAGHVETIQLGLDLARNAMNSGKAATYITEQR